MAAVFTFHGDLTNFLRPKWRQNSPAIYPVTRRASVKDVIESMGIPHTEIGRIERGKFQVNFACLVEDNQQYDLFGIKAPWDVTKPTLLRPEPLAKTTFIVDVNVGRLARYLRMAGFDTRYDHRWGDTQIIDKVSRERMIVLSRNLGLLKTKQVEFGRYVRTEFPIDQLNEIVHFFGLEKKILPFSRCLDCNSLLTPIPKSEIQSRLEPLTRKYYTSFSMCTACDKIYWAGSHRCRMEKILQAAGFPSSS